jgi:hypothetical protein
MWWGSAVQRIDEIDYPRGTDQGPGASVCPNTYDQFPAPLREARGQDQRDQQRVRRRRPRSIPPSFGQNSKPAGPGPPLESYGELRPAY